MKETNDKTNKVILGISWAVMEQLDKFMSNRGARDHTKGAMVTPMREDMVFKNKVEKCSHSVHRIFSFFHDPLAGFTSSLNLDIVTI